MAKTKGTEREPIVVSEDGLEAALNAFTASEHRAAPTPRELEWARGGLRAAITAYLTYIDKHG